MLIDTGDHVDRTARLDDRVGSLDCRRPDPTGGLNGHQPPRRSSRLSRSVRRNSGGRYRAIVPSLSRHVGVPPPCSWCSLVRPLLLSDCYWRRAEEQPSRNRRCARATGDPAQLTGSGTAREQRRTATAHERGTTQVQHAGAFACEHWRHKESESIRLMMRLLLLAALHPASRRCCPLARSAHLTVTAATTAHLSTCVLLSTVTDSAIRCSHERSPAYARFCRGCC